MKKKGKIASRYIAEKYGASLKVRYLGGHKIVPITYVQH